MTNREMSELDNLVAGYRGTDRFNTDVGLEGLHRRIKLDQSVAGQTSGRRRWLSIAASILVLVIAGSITFATLLAKTTFTAEQTSKTLQLPDGTEVVLKAGSSLSFGSDYDQDERRIILDGEAFFSVIHNPEKPFIAERNDVLMRVVGTSFNLRIIPELSIFEVEVASGQVMLETQTNQMAVAAHEFGRSVEGALVKMSAPHLNRHAWRTKKLVFEKTSFSEAVDIVQGVYGVIIKLGAKNTSGCDFELTASFVDASLEDVLAHLEKLSGGKFLRSEDGAVYRLIDWCK